MKKFFKILHLGLKDPRFYIDALNFKFKQFIPLGLLAILAMSLSLGVGTLPLLNSISDDFKAAIPYVPDFSIENSELVLSEEAKPLYYDSRYVKVVIDDELAQDQTIPSVKQEKLDKTAPFMVYLIKDNAFMAMFNNVYQIQSYDYLFANTQRFNLFLDYIASPSWLVFGILFISLFIVSLLTYAFYMLMIAILIGIFNVRMQRPIPFIPRLKLAMISSFIPLLLLELMAILIPGFIVSDYSIVFITLVIVYLAFRNHTQFIRQLLDQFNDMDSFDLPQDKNENTDDNKD